MLFFSQKRNKQICGNIFSNGNVKVCQTCSRYWHYLVWYKFSFKSRFIRIESVYKCLFFCFLLFIFCFFIWRLLFFVSLFVLYTDQLRSYSGLIWRGQNCWRVDLQPHITSILYLLPLLRLPIHPSPPKQCSIVIPQTFSYIRATMIGGGGGSYQWFRVW